MMKRVDIRHITRYSFGSSVRLGPHRLFLRPREGHDLRIAASALNLLPEATIVWRRDFYDNVLAIVTFTDEPVDTMAVESRVKVELYDTTPLDFIVEQHAVRFPLRYTAEEQR